MVDIKLIYLNKGYLFQNKIYYLDKIYLSFAKTKFSKHTLYRSSRPEVFCKKGVLRNRAKFLNWLPDNIKKRHVLQYLTSIYVPAYWKSSNSEACAKKLQTTLIMEGEGDWSQNLCEVLPKK